MLRCSPLYEAVLAPVAVAALLGFPCFALGWAGSPPTLGRMGDASRHRTNMPRRMREAPGRHDTTERRLDERRRPSEPRLRPSYVLPWNMCFSRELVSRRWCRNSTATNRQETQLPQARPSHKPVGMCRGLVSSPVKGNREQRKATAHRGIMLCNHGTTSRTSSSHIVCSNGHPVFARRLIR